MSEQKMQLYEVHYSSVKPKDMPKAKEVMQKSGMEGIMETPRESEGNIRGLLRATDINEAEHMARQVLYLSGGAIKEGMHIRNITQGPTTAERIRHALGFK
ncbi:MAG TPA: hypothetical protein VMV00_01090 [Candidatus Baltobacteraceae bacterium]|nr:hypothetical protein [Candidatus Baltobacteraceae bacterium]